MEFRVGIEKQYSSLELHFCLLLYLIKANLEIRVNRI